MLPPLPPQASFHRRRPPPPPPLYFSQASFLTVADQLDALRYDDGLLLQHATSSLRHASNFASAGMAVAHGGHGH